MKAANLRRAEVDIFISKGFGHLSPWRGKVNQRNLHSPATDTSEQAVKLNKAPALYCTTC